jgi:hypothetical protein
MPRASKWQAQHATCQAAVDTVKAHYEAVLQQQITFTCAECGEYFDEPISAFAGASDGVVLAPTLCEECGHGAEDGE